MEETDSSVEEFSSPNKRQKTQIQSSPLSKGKEKIDEIEVEEEPMDSDDSKVCGICFSEDGKSMRGLIDSCNHYFCFVCIMEWSKVESRCPLCKQRFKTISRKPKDGVFLTERIVKVPVRNQVWHPLGNQTSEISDPYAQVHCTECRSSSDENLLLLCDLCDSAAHTYCVGLGYTVPEGDWYCHDCTILRNEHFNRDDDTVCQEFTGSGTTLKVVTSVCGSETVRELCSRNVSRYSGRNSSCRDQMPSHVPDRGITPKIKTTDSSVRTLRHCRSVHNRIKIIRQNWDAIRNGSMTFSSKLSDKHGKNNKKQENRAVDKSSEPQSSSSTNCTQNTTKDNSLGDKMNNKGPYDIDRAWKMLDIAQSVQRAREGTRNSRLQSKRDVPKEAKFTTSTVSMPESKLFQPKDMRAVIQGKNYNHRPVDIAQQKHKTLSFEEKRAPGTHPLQSCELPLVKQAHTVGQIDICIENSSDANRTFTNINKGSGSMRPVFQKDSSSKVSDVNDSRPKSGASSCSKEELPKKNGMDKIMVRNDNGAKCEVQSLVKLNLKLLYRDKELGVNGFKEVARLATHTILAACGLEHKESSVRPYPDSTCQHNGQMKQLHMSNLMPSSCRECFYAFVKDVVSSIMAERAVLV
ncbi:Phd and ring finger domain-containing protein [Thalictrum thalictroides]|uniref:Phd and ring finger domain-containing protein n=1 Tax=Thalictrum thalictroides TaxID=46969 RepID=A0A7J6XBM5_THATH|nr:Phd and ring finger domain-containing protein [Thalictrum thalictroides]